MAYTKEKKPEKDPLDPQTVFRIKHSEIPQGVTQCAEHRWRKLNDHEIECAQCPTVNIVDNAEAYINT